MAAALVCMAIQARRPPHNHAIWPVRRAAEITNMPPDLNVGRVTLSDH
jgi:hypothetical protein